jgi:hypothetical protein
MVELYLSSTIRLYGVMINRLDTRTTSIVYIFSVSLGFLEITKQNGGRALQLLRHVYISKLTPLSRDLTVMNV